MREMTIVEPICMFFIILDVREAQSFRVQIFTLGRYAKKTPSYFQTAIYTQKLYHGEITSRYDTTPGLVALEYYTDVFTPNNDDPLGSCTRCSIGQQGTTTFFFIGHTAFSLKLVYASYRVLQKSSMLLASPASSKLHRDKYRCLVSDSEIIQGQPAASVQSISRIT